MIIRESAEDYLETILIIHKRKGIVRSIDITEELDISKASVCVAMRNLRQGRYIQMNERYEITLTDTGKEIAERMYERHIVFSEFLSKLGIKPEQAIHDACRMEHAISNDSFQALKKYLIQNGLVVSTDSTISALKNS